MTSSQPIPPERCFLLNLDRRRDRLEQFSQELPQPWPLSQVERCVAVDGRSTAPPADWQVGRGAWGCFQSHLRLLRQCLEHGINSYAVFEDDAVFRDSFSDRFDEFMKNIPDDWGLAYMGGQHLLARRFAPTRVNDVVYRPYNVNRTHAFMVRGRATMKKLHDHLTRAKWKRGHHLDHHLGRLVQRQYLAAKFGRSDERSVPCYVPSEWMVGQRGSPTDVGRISADYDRYFDDVADVGRPNDPFVAVMGPHRSGSSCLAMVLHHLGVHMGNKLVGYEPTGGGEAVGLGQLCRRVMPFPHCELVWPQSRIVRDLKGWIIARKQEALRNSTIAGGKYPQLCMLGECLQEAAGPGLKILSIDRPLEDSIQSLVARSQKHPNQWFSASAEACAALQTKLYRSREKFLAENPNVPRLRIEYYQLLAHPEQTISEVVQFLGIQPSTSQFVKAIQHIRPELAVHRSGG